VSEGELKKRFKEALPDWWRQTEGANAVTWALDEAKKEFPDAFNNYNLAKSHVAIKVWFTKWFGET